MFKGDAANKDMYNFSYVQWYQHVCVCISLSQSRHSCASYQLHFSSLCLTEAKGNPHVLFVPVPFRAPYPRARSTSPAVSDPHLGELPATEPGSCATVLLVLAPWPCCWGSLASAWLGEQWTQLQKTICFLRPFLLIFFNSLISTKFSSVVSLVRVLPGGNTVLQSEYLKSW